MFILKAALVVVFVLPILAGCATFVLCAARLQEREERGVAGEQ